MEIRDMTVKQIIVMRKDLGMKGGKLAGQACHATNAFIMDQIIGEKSTITFTKAQLEWKATGSTKIIKRVDSEEELQQIYEHALYLGLDAYLVQDAAKTVFKEPTFTCCAIGPDYEDKLNTVVGHLKLYSN